MSAYIKRNSDGRILSSSSGQDQNNPIHTEAMNNFVTSRGWSLDDYEIGFADDNVVDGWIKAQQEADKTYADKRKAEYDQLNQFEMQFDDQRDGTTTWVDAINEIKSRHPKG